GRRRRSSVLVAIGGIHCVHLPHQSVECSLTELVLVTRSLETRLCQHAVGYFPQVSDGGSRNLDVTGTLQQPKPHECLLQGLAPGQQSVVAKNHHALVPDARDHSLALVRLYGHTFELVIGNPPIELRPVEGVVRETLLETRHRTPGSGMRVHDAM